MEYQGFDKFFSNMPSLDRQKDFNQFWKKSLSEIKKIPIKPVIHKNSKASSHRFTVYEASYTGFMKSQIHGMLLVPKTKGKPKVIVSVHDYNNPEKLAHKHLPTQNAYFFLTLRGHDLLEETEGEEKPPSPGYMIEHIMDIDTYYAKAVYLDTYRSIDVLRLVPELDCSTIGIRGKGFGAAAGLFTASYSERVQALVLETPSFCELPKSQNLSAGEAAAEINEYVARSKAKKKQIKLNLTYFDALNFSDKLKCPVLVTVGLKDTIAPPECTFGLFHHFLTDKTMEVYPDHGNRAGGTKQFVKSIEWLTEKIRI